MNLKISHRRPYFQRYVRSFAKIAGASVLVVGLALSIAYYVAKERVDNQVYWANFDRRDRLREQEEREKDFDGRLRAVITTALRFGASEQRIAVIESLIKEGADVNSRTGFLGVWSTLLTQSIEEAVKDETRKAIVLLLLKNGANVNEEDSEGRTALILAIQKGDKELAEILIGAGADVNAHCHGCYYGDGPNYGSSIYHALTPLMVATTHNSIAIARLLIEKGAEVNDINLGGKEPSISALQIAMQQENEEMVQLLLAHGAKKELF